MEKEEQKKVAPKQSPKKLVPKKSPKLKKIRFTNEKDEKKNIN